jgi:SAM-dependent methyltransferase
VDIVDIPSGHSFFDAQYIRSWLEDTTAHHPERPVLFDAFVAEISQTASPALSVLELGSGPGVLAEHLLSRCSVGVYQLVDFSAPMQDLARERLEGDHRATFVLADFKAPAWVEQVRAPVHIVVSMQALHELRHSSRTPRLYRQLAQVASPGGLVLTCDQLRSADDDRRLYMTIDEHLAAMSTGGLDEPTIVKRAANMALFRARLPNKT